MTCNCPPNICFYYGVRGCQKIVEAEAGLYDLVAPREEKDPYEIPAFLKRQPKLKK